MLKTAALSLRISPDVRAAIARAAQADGRSVASYVERVLSAHLREAGFLTRDTAKKISE